MGKLLAPQHKSRQYHQNVLVVVIFFSTGHSKNKLVSFKNFLDQTVKMINIKSCPYVRVLSDVMIIVLTSCFNIILAILRIRSSEGRQKAFSTYASHMVAVTVFCGTLLFMYLQPRTKHSLDTDKMASVFYTPVIPMLNPLIYSLRNTDVKDALRFLDNPCQSFRLMQV